MTSTATPLPCGRRLVELVEARDTGHEPSGHDTTTCEHCRAALDRIERLEASVVELRAERVVAPPGFVDEVMRRIEVLRHTGSSVAGARLRTRGDDELTLATGAGGTTSVRSQVVAALVAASAHRFNAAQVVRVEARIEAADTTILAETIVAYPGTVQAAADGLRTHLLDDLRSQLGLSATIDVRIVGFLTPRRSAAHRGRTSPR